MYWEPLLDLIAWPGKGRQDYDCAVILSRVPANVKLSICVQMPVATAEMYVFYLLINLKGAACRVSKAEQASICAQGCV